MKCLRLESAGLVLELDGTDSDATLRQCVWGLDLAGQSGSVNSRGGAGGIGGLLAVWDTAASAKCAFMYDANGNVADVVKGLPGTFTPVAHYEYDPFGKRTYEPGETEIDQPFQFSTKYFDAETNLYDFGRRFYNAGWGRWINRDPIAELGGANLYLYVHNNPVNAWDRLGMCATGWYGQEVTPKPSEDTKKKQPDPCPKKDEDGAGEGASDEDGVPKPFVFENPPGCCKDQRDQWGWIECCNGKVTVCIGTSGRNLPPELKECLIESHERVHAGQYPPDYCDNRPDGHWIGSDESRRTVWQNECDAYKDELKCVANIDCGTKHPNDKKAQKDCEKRKKGRRIWICGRLTSLRCPETCKDLIKDGQWIGQVEQEDDTGSGDSRTPSTK